MNFFKDIEEVKNLVLQLNKLGQQILIFDNKYEFVCATNICNKLAGDSFNWEDYVGFSYNNLPSTVVNYICDYYDLKKETFINSCNEIHSLVEYTCNSGKLTKYLDFFPFIKSNYCRINYLTPLFTEDYNTLGVMNSRLNFSFFGNSEFINYICNSSQKQGESFSFKSSSSIRLAPRQQEIIFLLSNHFSQRDAARILNISRGTIAKTIKLQLLPKFNLESFQYNELISRAIDEGFNELIPERLQSSYIIKLDH